jgi:mRNA-degrading endonuclease RelE of RelBE toxin-antitoxin system
MVTVDYSPNFASIFQKIKDSAQKERVRGQIRKIASNPEVGKPMRFARKGTRELYVAPFRLSYAYLKAENKVVLLDLYHKDRQ